MLGALAPIAGVVGTALLVALPGPAATPAVAVQAAGSDELTPQTDASLPARNVTMIGSSPGEAPGETWGIGRYNGVSVLVRYSDGSGWSLAPGLLDSSGHPLSGFKLAQPEASRYPNPSPLAGQMTVNGDGALLGTIPETEGAPGSVQRIVLVREPGAFGGAFKETAPVPAGLLPAGESLFGLNRAPMVAALEEPGGRAGALVVPVGEAEGIDSGVLHWDGSNWTREPIEIPAKSDEQFEVLAMGASSPGNAWLLARLSPEYPTGSVALFRRHLGGGGEATWRAVAPKPGGEAGEPLSVPIEGAQTQPFAVPSVDQSQLLTVAGEGVWIDGLRRDAHASTTMFLEPEGETTARVVDSWCKIPASAPTSTPKCEHELPEALPTGPSRSLAWANPSTPEDLGERIITGFLDGVSLRLEGTGFVLVPALGGDTGASFGAAFSSADEGWLGKELLPVRLAARPQLAPSRLAPWPVSFRHALVALAPQPGMPVGSISSEALAVGDQGEVARYQPGKGWLPETLLGAGGRHDATPLRAVAWPTPARAYAVGTLDEESEPQMWLWRAETKLWEPDPAMPPNFRGNLLGIVFEPGNASRGYAVGQQGVLLRYGKTWTQERTCTSGVPQPCLPPLLAGASFTSVAFAGSEAIVAYRKLPNPSLEVYEGGLLVNDGSGWRIDEGAAQALGANVPWAVAGLPDGGAAFTAAGHGESSQVFERESAGAVWQPAPSHLPVGDAPGSLTLFREGGALRAIVAGSEPNTFPTEDEPSPPPGAPPTLVPPYPLPANQERGVLRQTATGWSDEEHELNNAKEPPGEYAHYDTPYEPDPVAALLVDATGSQGWAVGGVVDDEKLLTAHLDTADVWRYPADGAAPVGVGSSAVSTKRGEVAFAIGGGAQCAAPCAERAQTRIGPDVWLAHALAVAGQIPAVRSFLYTGPRVTSGETAGPATLAIPRRLELERYATVARSGPKPAYVVASPTDLDDAGSEGVFEEAFGGFPQPFGEPRCEAPGCQSAYYAFSSAGVRVIVLDEATPVQPIQLTWLEHELEAAKAQGNPAIVVGNGEVASAQLAAVLVSGSLACRAKPRETCGASAYFFDSPERNIELPLRSGAASIPSFGSGTLGYVGDVAETVGGFIGASGFLLTQVDVAARQPATNVAPVDVELIPNIGELAMEAEEGTLLQRSHAALFDALARRPRAGNRASNQSVEDETSPYIPIPSNCVGTDCAEGIFPEFTFSSSRPEIGGFVRQNLVAESHGHAVLLGADGKPIREPVNAESHVEESKSNLFCAYNPGTTIVTINAGGLSYSLPVTVQAGSVRQPCGTVPLNKAPAGSQVAAAPVPPPAPAPGPTGPAPASSSPVLPVPPPPLVAVTAPPPARPAPVPPTPFFVQPALPFVALAFVPPPLPAPAEPTPPSGTSAVTSPVEAAQKEEEEEEATESVSNQALAYRAPDHEPSPVYVLGIVLLAAFAGAAGSGRMRRGRHELRIAPATLSTVRAQRRMAPRRGRPF
jgi:hypothetical protein